MRRSTGSTESRRSRRSRGSRNKSPVAPEIDYTEYLIPEIDYTEYLTPEIDYSSEKKNNEETFQTLEKFVSYLKKNNITLDMSSMMGTYPLSLLNKNKLKEDVKDTIQFFLEIFFQKTVKCVDTAHITIDKQDHTASAQFFYIPELGEKKDKYYINLEKYFKNIDLCKFLKKHPDKSMLYFEQLDKSTSLVLGNLSYSYLKKNNVSKTCKKLFEWGYGL